MKTHDIPKQMSEN